MNCIVELSLKEKKISVTLPVYFVYLQQKSLVG